MSDILALPDEERHLLVWVLRRCSVEKGELLAHLRQEKNEVEAMLARLEDMGFLRRSLDRGEVRYSVAITKRKSRSTPADA